MTDEVLWRETVVRCSWVVLVAIAAVMRCSCLGLMRCWCERLLCGALGLVLSLISLLLLIILTTRDEVLVRTLLQVCRHTQAARVRHALAYVLYYRLPLRHASAALSFSVLRIHQSRQLAAAYTSSLRPHTLVA